MRCEIHVILLVMCGAVTVLASQWCSREDAEIAKTLIRDISRHGDSKALINEATEFFVRLMERDPSTKALFANVNVDDVHSPEFGAHVLRVATAITYTIEAVQDENLVEQITSHLAAQHAARNGVKVEHFDFLREIMKEDMRVWSTNFNEDAWDNCVDPILKAVSARLT